MRACLTVGLFYKNTDNVFMDTFSSAVMSSGHAKLVLFFCLPTLKQLDAEHSIMDTEEQKYFHNSLKTSWIDLDILQRL